MSDDRLIRAVGRTMGNADLAGQQDKGARRDLAGRKDARPARVSSALSETADPVDLGCRQHWKNLVAAASDHVSGGRVRHGQPPCGVARRQMAIAASPYSSHRSCTRVGEAISTNRSRSSSYRRRPASMARMGPGWSLSSGRAPRGPGGRDDAVVESSPISHSQQCHKLWGQALSLGPAPGGDCAPRRGGTAAPPLGRRANRRRPCRDRGGCRASGSRARRAGHGSRRGRPRPRARSR